MYLQTYSCIAICACRKTQAGSGIKRYRAFAYMSALLLFLGSSIAVSPLEAQMTEPAVAGHASINSEGINGGGSSALGMVNFVESTPPAEVNQLESSLALPEAPSALLQIQSLRAATPPETPTGQPTKAPPVAPMDWMRIPAGWAAQPLTARDKMAVGAHDLYSPLSMLSWVVAAGYEHLKNGQPNYGTNSGAFAERFGAAVLRDTTEDAFTDVVFAPLLHEDPRYYVQGEQKKFLHRVMYAITRPLVTRTDSGRETVNGAELLGYASASALTYAYYPKINQNFHDTAATFGGAIGGSALTDLVSEFAGQILEAVHLKKTQ